MSGKYRSFIIPLLSLALGLAGCGVQGLQNVETPEGEETAGSKALVPAGEYRPRFQRGVTQISQIEPIFVDDFYIDRHEVTNRQYTDCVAAGACTEPVSTKYYQQPDYADHPVLYITRDMAQSFCQWNGSRLPTRSEWEKAFIDQLQGRDYPVEGQVPVCLEGETSGAEFDPAGHWSEPNTAAIDSSPPNDYGLADVAGNTLEWVQGPESGGEDKSIAYLRLNRYSGYGPLFGRYYCSFRCARSR